MKQLMIIAVLENFAAAAAAAFVDMESFAVAEAAVVSLHYLRFAGVANDAEAAALCCSYWALAEVVAL